MRHALFSGPSMVFCKWHALQMHRRRQPIQAVCATLTFPWKSPDEMYSESCTQSNSSKKIHITHTCFLLLWHSWGTPEANTHTHTNIHSLRTLGQIPVLSGCCGTSELSKPHHNPSHGSGRSVRSQFTVRLPKEKTSERLICIYSL